VGAASKLEPSFFRCRPIVVEEGAIIRDCISLERMGVLQEEE
jgi:hypothetical protein